MAARVLIAAQTTPGAYPTLPLTANSRDLAFSACDASSLNYTPLVADKTILIAKNTGAGNRTITIESAADSTTKRTGDLGPYTLGAGELGLFGPFKLSGWSQVGPDIALANPSAAADDIIDTSSAHGLQANDPVMFTALTGGSGLVTGTVYYVSATSLTSTGFRVSTVKGGAPLGFSTDITAGNVVKADDNLWFTGSHAEMTVAVISLP